MSPKVTAPARRKYLTASAPQDDPPPPAGGTKGWRSGIGHPRGKEGGGPPPTGALRARTHSQGEPWTYPIGGRHSPRWVQRNPCVHWRQAHPARGTPGGGRCLCATLHPAGSMSPGVGVPGETPDGRTLAVRPPVSPSVGTFFSRVRVRLVLPRRPCSPIPFPLSLRVLASALRAFLLGRGARLWVRRSLRGGASWVPGGVRSCMGWVGVLWVLCLRSGVGHCWGVLLLGLRLF